MSLEERVYSVLIVSASESINGVLTSLLPASSYSPVKAVFDVSSAKREFAERQYDIVIVNSPLPDDTGIRFAIDTCNYKGTVALILVKTEFFIGVNDKATENGVFTLQKPTSKLSFVTALNWLSCARERLRKAEIKNLSIEEKMEEIRVVNRAKWLLISELKMDEPDAHRYIEKQAMDKCLTRKEIAEEIIKIYSR